MAGGCVYQASLASRKARWPSSYLEIGGKPGLRESSLNMTTPTYVFTNGRVAEILAEDED